MMIFKLLIFIVFPIVFGLAMIGMYFVKDYQNGYRYKGFSGQLQSMLNNIETRDKNFRKFLKK